MKNGYFKNIKIESKNSYNQPLQKISYKPSMFGFRDICCDGKYVRISIIDSGLPNHDSILVDEYKSKNFSLSEKVSDINGHSTALSGILAANGNKGIKGIAPHADLFFAKVLSDDGYGSFDAVIDAILWSIVRDVDIILMAFGCPFEHKGLHDVIKKAYKSGIHMFAAAGNCSIKTKDVDFPARYDEVFAVGYSKNIVCNEIISNSKTKGIVLPFGEFETTFLNSNFTRVSGSSMFTAALAGIGVLFFQNMRSKGIDVKKEHILYEEIRSNMFTKIDGDVFNASCS